MATVITDACTNCTICAPACPTGSIMAGTTTYVIDFDTCTECQVCVGVCPVGAIVPDKKTKK